MDHIWQPAPFYLGIYSLFTGGKQKTVSEYVQGGGRIKLLPAAISLTVSFVSSILVLGYPAEVRMTLTLEGIYDTGKLGETTAQ